MMPCEKGKGINASTEWAGIILFCLITKCFHIKEVLRSNVLKLVKNRVDPARQNRECIGGLFLLCV